MGFETARHLANLGMHVVIGRLLSDHMPLARSYAGYYISLLSKRRHGFMQH